MNGYAPYGRRLVALDGEAETEFWPDGWGRRRGYGHDDGGGDDGDEHFVPMSRCVAACVERGTRESLVPHAMPQYHYRGDGSSDYDDDDVKRSLTSWINNECQMVEFGFINYHDTETRREIDLYWLNTADGSRQLHSPLKYGEENTRWIGTYLGHTFQMNDPRTGEMILEHTVEFNGILPVGMHPSIVDKNKYVYEEIRATADQEWDKHLEVKRTFSSLGFSKGRLPDDLFASMDSFNYNNDAHKALEEWAGGGKGLYVNWWESDCFFIQVRERGACMWDLWDL